MRPKWQGIALVAVCVAISVQAGIGCGKPFKAATTQQAKKTHTRDEFRKMVVGKTKDEVLAAFGRPDKTDTNGRRESWYYYEMTIDTVTGKTDRSAMVEIEDGVVSSVVF